MELIINNKIITEPIENIIDRLRKETDYNYFRTIGQEKRDNVAVTCPYHKDGQESHPSCYIYARRDNPEVTYGTVHCFTCGVKVPLYALVGHCFDEGDEFGKEWLVERFGDFFEQEDYLPAIELDEPEEEKNFLDEAILEKFNEYNDYIEKRHLNIDICRQFKIGFNRQTNAVTFPVWDSDSNLVMITERCVNEKRFSIPADVEKPVYLLNFILKQNLTTVYVCESQINALTLWGWGYPAVALFGTGSKYQYKILRNTGITNYVLCFDGDEAGAKGRQRFINAMNDDVFITSKILPKGKDCNDLTKEEFDSLEIE